MNNKEEKKQDKIQVQQLRPPKMKDRDGRSRMMLNLKQVFGFIPEIIIIDKVPHINNQIIISAVIPEKLIEREKDGNSKPNKRGKSKPKESTPKS